MYGLESDFNFVKGMVKERDAMAQKVGTALPSHQHGWVFVAA